MHAMVAGVAQSTTRTCCVPVQPKEVLPRRVMAPSTLGTFLQAFSFGHVCQLEAVLARGAQASLERHDAPRASGDRSGLDHLRGGGQEEDRCHFLLATRADTGEVRHARLCKRSANTCRGAKRFVEELVARLGRAGASGTLIMRVDSGLWSKDLLSPLERLEVSYAMAGQKGTQAIAAVIATIAEEDWVRIVYREGVEATVAEATDNGRRRIVRRIRLVGSQVQLWPDWRHFAFVGDLTGIAVEVDAFRRERAQAELDIGNLYGGGGHGALPLGQLLGQRRLATPSDSLAPSWPTTCSAGPSSWADSTGMTVTDRLSLGGSARASCPCSVASSGARGRGRFGHQATGRGKTRSPTRFGTCAPSRSPSPDSSALRSAQSQTNRISALTTRPRHEPLVDRVHPRVASSVQQRERVLRNRAVIGRRSDGLGRWMEA